MALLIPYWDVLAMAVMNPIKAKKVPHLHTIYSQSRDVIRKCGSVVKSGIFTCSCQMIGPKMLHFLGFDGGHPGVVKRKIW